MIGDWKSQIGPEGRGAEASNRLDRGGRVAGADLALSGGPINVQYPMSNHQSSISPNEPRAATGATRELLMVPPTYYGIEYEINPWMDLRRPADRAAAAQQWDGLYTILTDAIGAKVTRLDPVPGLPDMVFTANAGLIEGDCVILSHFRHPQRQGEAPRFRRWFEERGLRVETLPEEVYFEGEGDALFLGHTLFAGYRWRSDAR